MLKLHLAVPLVCLLVVPAHVAIAQDVGPLKLSLGVLKTELEKSAMRFVSEYAKDYSQAAQENREKSLVYYAPEINVETGGEDSFSSIVAKMSAVYMRFQTTTVDSAEVLKTGKWFHIVPLSFGFESNREFTNVAGLLELGYIPYYQGQVLASPSAVLRELAKTRIGLFAQGGYKFDAIAIDSLDVGGAANKSEEVEDDGVLRFKLSTAYAPKFILDHTTGLGLSVIGASDVWYDAWNSEFYSRAQVTLRLMLSSSRYFDFLYEHGSGAPNFNKAEQFSANLTVQY